MGTLERRFLHILYGLRFVMVERKGGTTDGLIPEDKMSKFKDSIREGAVYKIEQYLKIKAK